jgi:predicted Zn-dependent protease
MRWIVRIAIIWVALAGLSANAGATSRNLPLDPDEKRLWERAIQEQKHILQSGHVLANDALQDYIGSVLGRLRPPIIPDHLVFQTLIIKAPRVDAFTYPNGLICIFTGILARMDNEAQLAVLLGHEMGHCIHRHSLRAMGSRTDREFAEVSRILSEETHRTMLRSSGSSTLGPDYPRVFEREADRMALELVVAAGYDAREALGLFDILLEGKDWKDMGDSHGLLTGSDIRLRRQAWQEALQRKYAEPVKEIRNEAHFLDRTGAALLVNARLELQAGNFTEALKQLEKYLNHHPQEAHVHYLCGEAFRQRAKIPDMKKALTCYQEAISLDPDFSGAYQRIGLIHYKAGRKDLAREAFQTCLRLDPNSPDRAYTLSYINRCSQNE